MAGNKRNIIEKQYVDLNVLNEGDVFHLRNELEEVCKKELLPEIEKLFDNIVPADKLIRIESLEIDAGTIKSESWKKDFVEKVVREISEKIEMLNVEKFTGSEAAKTIINEEDNKQNMFLFFLENGSLPWYCGIKSRAELNSLLDDILRSGNQNFFNRLKDLLKNQKNSINRLILQFDESELNRLSETLYQEEYKTGILNILDSALNMLNIQYGQKKVMLYRKWFEILSSGKSGKSYAELMKEISLGILRSPQIKNDKELTYTFVNNLAEHLKNNKYSGEILKSLKGNIPVKEINLAEPDEALTSSSEFYIENSGLVLLNPFLIKLFENTGYVENKEWISKELQQRAIALTQYAITGKEEYPEFLLMLNKVICGYEITESLPFDIKLSEFEKNEADDLLNSVIGHWSAVKNTSINGLRESFFIRKGKLFFDQNGWLLQVEVKTVDILLNKLPWGISMIKLPWMKEMLRVEWSY